MYVGLAPGTADPGLRIADQTCNIHGSCLDQRQEYQLNSAWVAARNGNQPCLRNLIAVHFAKPIFGRNHHIWRSMSHAVQLFPFHNVLDAQVCGKIDHANTGRGQREGPPSWQCHWAWQETPRRTSRGSQLQDPKNSAARGDADWGNMSPTGVPASLRDVMTASSASGCVARNRSNSTPCIFCAANDTDFIHFSQ